MKYYILPILGQYTLDAVVVDSVALELLKYVERFRSRLEVKDKEMEFDGVNRDTFVHKIRNHNARYSGDEEQELSNGISMINKFQLLKRKRKVELTELSQSTSAEIGMMSKTSEVIWGKAETSVHASLDDILAFLWNFDSFARAKASDLEKVVIEDENLHHIIQYECTKGTHIGHYSLRPREKIQSLIWMRSNNGKSVVLTGTPTNNYSFQPTNRIRGKVRVNMPFVFKLEQRAQGRVRLLYCVHLGKNETLPIKILEERIKINLNLCVRVQQYFEELQPLANLDVQNGENIGHALCMRRKLERGRGGWGGNHISVSVNHVMKDFYAFQELAELYPWFRSLLEGILDNNIYLFPPEIDLKLMNLSNIEAKIIGQKLAKSLKQRKTAEVGVDQWMVQHPAMVELSENYPFFIPMVIVIGRQKVMDALWGARFRVYFGASLSLLDVVTDVQVVTRFFLTDKAAFAWLNLAFIGVSILLQLLMVIVQNRRRGFKVISYEMLIVVSMVKGAVGARRVAYGNVHVENTLIDPQMELLWTKTIEIFSESIPSCILQTFALLGASDLTEVALWDVRVISIIISAFTISYTSTSISIDKDADPVNRQEAPEFFGYVPDNGRFKVMIFMIGMSFFHVLMKMLACSLILRVSELWFIIYLIGDLSLFLVYKAVCGDLRYYIKLDGLISWLATIIFRTVSKSIADFTLLVHMRHPYEMGGRYWLANVFMNQVFCFISVYIYCRYSIERSLEEQLTLWKLVGLLFFCSLSFLCSFLTGIDQKHLITFYSSETGPDFAIDNWRNCKTDEKRIEIFRKHRSYYKPIEKEIKRWVGMNWGRWCEDGEDWFDDDIKNLLPLELLPESAVAFLHSEKSIKNLIQQNQKFEGAMLMQLKMMMGRGSISSRRSSGKKNGAAAISFFSKRITKKLVSAKINTIGASNKINPSG